METIEVRPDPTKTGFQWKAFFKRTWPVYAIAIFWTVESWIKHDVTGLWIAVILGLLVAPVGYFWTRSRPMNS